MCERRKGGGRVRETESLFFHLAKALADLKLLTVFISDGRAINRKACRSIFSTTGLYLYLREWWPCRENKGLLGSVMDVKKT